ncbi:MAG TPA: hypothetical protein VGD30_15330, partial [Telluria sp.]
MNGWLGQAMRRVALRRAGWRRKHNFAAARGAAGWRPTPAQWMVCAGVVAALTGAVVMATHARQLAATADAAVSAADVFQPAMPGATFDVPSRPGVALQQVAGGAFVVAAGMRAAPAVVVDLCADRTQPARRIAPVRVG